MSVRVRFAPSPTGSLHVGGARTALFNYFFAKAKGGKFILRVEDTDTERNKPEFEREIMESLAWLGMKWDEGPFHQTKRFDVYRSYVTQLLQKQKAYRCYCSPEALAQMRKDAEAAGKKPKYDGRCRNRTEPGEGPSVVRFKTPLTGDVVIQDAIKGEVRVNVQELDDFIILRSNDTPIYNFTVVVDDVDMKITHVIRAEEHLNNTPRQVLLMEALGWTPPQYAHVPLVLAPDKTKLSKRHGAVAVSDYRKQGYLKEALVSYLVRLGWGKGDQELFTSDELEKEFDLSGCGASGSVFDVKKLDWVNAQFIARKDPRELVSEIKDLYGTDLSPLLATEVGVKLFRAIAQRAVRLKDFVEQTPWALSDDFPKDEKAVETIVKTAKPEALAALRAELALIEADGGWKAENLAPAFKRAAEKVGLKMPDVAKPARILLTGTLASPDIGLVTEFLGPERTRQRLAACC